MSNYGLLNNDKSHRILYIKKITYAIKTTEERYLTMRLNPTPVKVYKTTLSIIMGVVLFTAIIAFLVWVVFSSGEYFWIMLILMGAMAYFAVDQMIYFIRCRHDSIVITEDQLIISRCAKQKTNGAWKQAKNVKISWRNINRIYAQWEHPTSKSIRKDIYISVGKYGKNELYVIDPDVYDVFFLEKKLQKYQQQYG